VRSLPGPGLHPGAGRHGNQALVAKVNVDEEAGLAATFGIQVLPTLVILKGGRVVQRFTGVQYAKPLIRALQAAGS